VADQNDPNDPNRPQPSSLPVFWKSGGKTVGKTSSPIHMPTLSETASFAQTNITTCGSCRHFRGPEKDRATISGFVAQAIHEAGWKKLYLGDKPERLGRCTEDAELVVGPNSKSCSRYTKR
jgi:hypothetical protein